jgi:hypothetical protein
VISQRANQIASKSDCNGNKIFIEYNCAIGLRGHFGLGPQSYGIGRASAFDLSENGKGKTPRFYQRTRQSCSRYLTCGCGQACEQKITARDKGEEKWRSTFRHKQHTRLFSLPLLSPTSRTNPATFRTSWSIVHRAPARTSKLPFNRISNVSLVSIPAKRSDARAPISLRVSGTFFLSVQPLVVISH